MHFIQCLLFPHWPFLRCLSDGSGVTVVITVVVVVVVVTVTVIVVVIVVVVVVVVVVVTVVVVVVVVVGGVFSGVFACRTWFYNGRTFGNRDGNEEIFETQTVRECELIDVGEMGYVSSKPLVSFRFAVIIQPVFERHVAVATMSSQIPPHFVTSVFLWHCRLLRSGQF